jgi:integrase
MKSQTPKTPTGKASKGTVSVENFRNRLRLRFRYGGKQHNISMGLPDTKENRKIAEATAKKIERDIFFDEKFDITKLDRYKPKHTLDTQSDTQQSLDTLELFQKFTVFKLESVSSRYIATCYNPTANRLKEYRKNIETAENAKEFSQFLAKSLSPAKLKQRLQILVAAYEWGIEQGLVASNPFKGLSNKVKVPPKMRPKPFTKDEVKAIVEGFGSDKYYKYYTNYVRFLLFTGCRISEVIALQWKHVSDDFSSILIIEAVSYQGCYGKRIRKETKTGTYRSIPCNNKLQTLLMSIKPKNYQPEDLVFPAPKGGFIHEGNFCKKAWKSVLTKIEIEYRVPYNCRHTFISHCLEAGMNPVVVAQITGHDVKVLYDHYAGVVSRPSLPELF